MASVLITGSTGMVGKGILLECLNDDSISEIILLNRSSVNINHPKIKEVMLSNFMEIESVKDQIGSVDACFHCMGVSSIGLNEEEYGKFTFDITKALTDACYSLNPNMVFNYVSGAGTDSSEKGKIMWARVKGRTENYILNKGFRKAFMFRPGAILPEKGVKSKVKLYNFIYLLMRPFFGLLKGMKSITTSSRIGLAMINSLDAPNDTPTHLENNDINVLANMNKKA